MTYLIFEILFFLFLAAVLGSLLGYSLGIGSGRALTAGGPAPASRLSDGLESPPEGTADATGAPDRDSLREELSKVEQERDQLLEERDQSLAHLLTVTDERDELLRERTSLAEERDRLRSELATVGKGAPERSASDEALRAAELRIEELESELRSARARREDADATLGADHALMTRAVAFLDAIRDRAYFLWLEEGCPSGRALDHWTRAEADVRRARELG